MKKTEELSTFKRLHAKLFNFGARAFGVMAIIWGMIFASWGLSLVLNPNATIDVNGVATNEQREKAIILIMGLVLTVLGILILKARPYQPRD